MFKLGKHKMRNGLDATIHEVNAQSDDYKLLGIYTAIDDNGRKHRIIGSWTKEGKWDVDCESGKDLMPEKNSFWLNIYETDTGYITQGWRTKQQADTNKLTNAKRAACIKIEYESGDGA